jgi:hypothetical protein
MLSEQFHRSGNGFNNAGGGGMIAGDEGGFGIEVGQSVTVCAFLTVRFFPAQPQPRGLRSAGFIHAAEERSGKH